MKLTKKIFLTDIEKKSLEKEKSDI